MKRKNYIFSLALALLMGTMTMSLTACSSEDIVANNTQQPAQGEVRTYTVSIPATFSGDEAQTRAVDFSGTDAVTGKPTAIATFATTDKIYVYKKSPSPAWLSWNSETSNFDYLSPNKAGTNCTLTGTITGQFAVGDVLELYYNMNYPDSDPANCAFLCDNQDGTASGVPDFAVATVKVKSIDAGIITFCQESDDTDETAHFENQLSMFRLSFTDGINPINVKRVIVTSDNDAIFSVYIPNGSPNQYINLLGYPILVALPTPTTEYIYVGIGINENVSSVGAEMNFEVEDADGKVYKGKKTAPADGFTKGKYYYSTSPVTVAYQFTRQHPTITWTTPSTPVEPDVRNQYIIEDNNFDITLSGTSNIDFFYMGRLGTTNGTVRLNGLTASLDFDTDFIYNNGGDLTIDLLNGSSNSIPYLYTAGNLKLSGRGTLTVKTTHDDNCGLNGNNYNASNNDYETTTELDVTSQLAAPGHTVTRSARLNVGGTYTWTYTVAPDLATPLTLEATADGSIEVYYPVLAMKYSVDGGALVEISTNTTINVTAGQKVSFYSTNSALAKKEGSILYTTSISPKIPCYVYGNVMSLIDDSGTGFANDKTISADNALKNLFHESSGTCPNLINHPTKRILLPATTLANNCYEQMFYGCTGLTVAPDLPATELKSKCYKHMFKGCTGLTVAPDLPAPTLADGCYWSMFEGCTSLNYVKCLATNVSATNVSAQFCLYKWLNGVSATGTFVKASSGADWAVADADGSNGYPSGWTVQTE